MHIEIDFDVFKTLTSLRESETDSYNSVLRRLLSLPTQATFNALFDASELLEMNHPQRHKNALADFVPDKLRPNITNRNALLGNLGGVWFGDTHFPDGTRFRANYKGQTHHAEIKDGRWVGQDGIVRRSPSDAAGAISHTNVNGWRFWSAMRPSDNDWARLDSFKR